MYQYKIILCFIVLFAICDARKNPPLKQLEGPWIITNASENALPIIGNCPSMHIEPSQEESSKEGVILFTSAIKTFTITIVDLDQKIYQLFYPSDSEPTLLGNVSLLHVEKSTFLITQLQTEGQIYYAVLTKENQTTLDIDKKIDKSWKSSKPSKTVSMVPTEYENCPNPPQTEVSETSNESTPKSSVKTTDAEQKDSSGISKDATVGTSTTDSQTPLVEVLKTTAVISTAPADSKSTTRSTTLSTSSNLINESSQISPDKTHTLPVVAGNDIINKTKLRNSAAASNLSSFLNLSTTLGLLFFFIVKTILI